MSNPDNDPPRRRAPVPAEACGLVHAAGVLGDRWTLLILREVFYGVRRFDDLQADLAAPRQALADRLGKMVEARLLERRPYREAGQRARYEYRPTPRAQALGPALIALMEWGEGVGGMEPALEFRRKDTGSVLRLALVDENGRAVPAHEVETVVRATGEVV